RAGLPRALGYLTPRGRKETRMSNGRGEPRRMRFSVESRLRIVRAIEGGMSPADAARAHGASRATGYRLWSRYRAGGWQGLVDRRSPPPRQPRRLVVGGA